MKYPDEKQINYFHNIPSDGATVVSSVIVAEIVWQSFLVTG
jgi:hypothetical protein